MGTLLQHWVGGVQGTQLPPRKSKIRRQRPSNITLGVYYYRRVRNVWGPNVFCYHEFVAFQTENYAKLQQFQSLLSQNFATKILLLGLCTATNI